MTIPLETGDVWQVRFVSYCEPLEQIGVNVRYYRIQQGGTNHTDEDLAFRMDTIFGLWFRELMPTIATYRGCSVQRFRPGAKTRPAINTTNAGAGLYPESGLADTDVLPGQVSGIISLQSDFAGARYRGRVYVPFPAATANAGADGTPGTLYMDALENLADALETVVQIDGNPLHTFAEPVLFHKKKPNDPDDMEFFQRVVRAFGKPQWATQRRRGGYGKINKIPF